MSLDPYSVEWRGGKLDPYRVARLFGITDPALAQALKKLLRCGRKHKSQIEDVSEVITSCQRFLAMEDEDDERARPLPPGLPKRITCPDCGKPSLLDSDYCATCRLEPGPR